MAAYYLDTSALVKRHAAEIGSPWIISITDPIAQHDLYTGLITGPEMIAPLFRKARTGTIDEAAATLASNDFRVDWQGQYLIIEITFAIADIAMSLAQKYGLRGYDSVHLAVAFSLHQRREGSYLSPLMFVSADNPQRFAAMNEGLAVENPNDHP